MLQPAGWGKSLEEGSILMSESQVVVRSLETGVTWVEINRPDALNALNSAVLTELYFALSKIAEDPAIRVVVLRGAGEKAFVAGADIREMSAMNRPEASDFSRLGHSVATLLENMPKPTIAAVHGFALGGGMEMAIACDFILASERAVFGLPEVSLGLMPGFGGMLRLQKLVGVSRAKELIFTGAKFNAEEARLLGLVRTVVPSAGFFEEVEKIATQLAGFSMTAITEAKALIQEFSEPGGLHSKVDAEALQFGALFDTNDAREGMTAFMEKRKAEFERNT
jgi:enoyl-CoA hydratase